MNDGCWFGPNVGSDIASLVERPDEWAEARAKTAVFQLYVQSITGDDPDYGGTGPRSCWSALSECGFVAKLAEWNIPLAIEAGLVKPGHCDGTACLDEIQLAIRKVREAGGEVRYVCLDEPLCASAPQWPDSCRLTLHQTAEIVAHAVEVITQYGVGGIEVVLVEAYPSARSGDLLGFVRSILSHGVTLAGLHLDVDRYAVRDQKIKDQVFQREIAEMQQWFEEFGLPFGLIYMGQRASSEGDYQRDVLALRDQIRRLGIDRGRRIVQSWATRGQNGPKDLPINLSETSPGSHTALLLEIA